MLIGIPPQVQVGEHRQTLDVHVRAIGDGKVTVSLQKPGTPRALRTMHAADDEQAILVAIGTIAREVTPQLERAHRAEMTARGYQ